MADEKDRFGETMRLVERAKEDIYFAERDREILEKLRAQLRRVEKPAHERRCPNCSSLLESYTFEGFLLDRCRDCGGVWMDKGELEGVIQKLSRGPLRAWIDKLLRSSKVSSHQATEGRALENAGTGAYRSRSCPSR